MVKKLCVLAAAAVLLYSTGCARNRQVHQFEPIPEPEVGAQELTPVQPPNTTDLLNRANDAFQRANKAQEEGNHEAALRDYKVMLELLVEADLDPSVLYSLRSQFERILDSGTEYAKLFDRNEDWRGKLPTVAGDIPIPFPLPPQVIAEIEEIQQQYPKNFQGGLNRSSKYLSHLQQELAKAGLPRDLVWLAMVESQFHPRVVSPAGATGMWQFMRETGRRHGLRIDSYVDERLSWRKSTDAAILYLTKLHDMFDGNWPLAISAYNMGEYGIERAVAAAGGEKDIWRLIETSAVSNRLPRETKKFYPKLLASIIVARSPEKYGFTLATQPPEEVVQVPVTGCYALAALDTACGLPEGTLRELNPELIRGVTPPSGDYRLAVPPGADAKLLVALKDVPTASAGSRLLAGGGSHTSGGTHVVKRGETLSEIADRYSVSVSSITRANGMRSSQRLLVGKRLTIPGAAAEAAAETTTQKTAPSQSEKESAKPAPEEPKKETRSAASTSYRVKTGDTLGKIAKAMDVSIKDLQQWNDLGRRSTIHPGQTLTIRSNSPDASSTPAGTKSTHVVKAGECPGAIAGQYGVKLDEFLSWNGLSRKSQIRVGQKLTVYAKDAAPAVHEAEPAEPAETPQSEAAPNEEEAMTVAQVENVAPSPAPSKPVETAPAIRKHTAKTGESAWTIAKKYGISTNDFIRWNGLTSKAIVKTGKEYIVSGSPAGAKPAEEAKADTAKTTVHVVEKGQNPSTIAKRYGVSLRDMYAWNGWTKDPVLKVGDKVTIRK